MSKGNRASAATGAPLKTSYGDEGIEAARRLVANTAGADAAAVFALIARIRQIQPPQRAFSLTAFDALAWPRASLAKRLLKASNAFCRAFSTLLLTGLGEDDADEPKKECGTPIEIAPELLALLDKDPRTRVDTRALLDADATTWAAIAVAAARSGDGHHLALRCFEADYRSSRDFAWLVAAAGANVIVWPPHQQLASAVLAAELFGGENTVVVADGWYLVSSAQAQAHDDWEFGATADAGDLVVQPAVLALLTSLQATRTTYVWRIPDRGVLPPKLRPLIAACFGPMRQDPGWRAAYIKGLVPGIEPDGVRVLLGQAEDARDAAAMARLAAAIAGGGVPGVASASDACTLLAGPRLASPVDDEAFDETLLACDLEGQQLLGCGRALAEGGRVLVYGPPGGGKSTFAKVLAARIAEASGGVPILVEPASLLARAWGATERLIAAFWQQASQTAAVVIADEFDSMAGVREADAPASGNALLIRSLTNEWIRQIDAYASVPLIVTVNDLRALDPAIRRRFPIALEVRGELVAPQEYRAWDTIIKMAPPPGWSPIGASISDYVSAREHCRVLGRDDALSYAAALAQARALRLGQAPRTGRSKRKARLN